MNLNVFIELLTILHVSNKFNPTIYGLNIKKNDTKNTGMKTKKNAQ